MTLHKAGTYSEVPAPKPIHPTQARLLEEIRRRGCGMAIVRFQDGLPMSFRPTDYDTIDLTKKNAG